jgi:branched-chain amino acid transport system substrate-binding protein
MHKRFFTLSFAAAAIALAASAFVGCKKNGGGGAGRDPNNVVIGHFASMTGDTATFGVSADEGIRLALDEINARGGVLGKPVKVITEDDRSQADEAKTAASKLVNQDHVVALLGEIVSSSSIAAAPVAQESKVPMVSPGSTNPKVTQMGDYVFRVCFIDPFQGTAMADFAMDKLKARRLAILYPVNSDYGVGLRDFFKIAVEKGGGQVVADLSYTEKSDRDFKAQLTKIKSANPDAIYVPGYYTELGLIAQQARGAGLNCPLLGGDGWDSDKTVQVGGKAVEGYYFTNHYSADEQRPEVQKFVADYKKKYNGKVPDAMAILGYDALKVLCDAIQRANSQDGPKIRDALAGTRNFPGACGPITIDENRNAKKNIVILKIEDGKFKYVDTVKPK